MHSFRHLASIYILNVLLISAYQHDSKCKEHKARSGEYINGLVSMNNNPLTPFDTPMLSVFNSTTSEVWAFDAGSHDGQTGITIYLSRGTVASNVAAQRALISVTWLDGTRYMKSSFLNESVVTVCSQTTTGLWTGIEKGNFNSNWRFNSSKDFKNTVVSVNTPEVQGIFELNSLGLPLYPDGLVYPDRRASLLFAPELYWQEQLPIASASVNMTIKGKPFVLSGIGGHDKNWNSRPWAIISENWDMARAIVGPYGLLFWNYTSAINGRHYFSATLMEKERVIFRTTKDSVSSESGGKGGTHGAIKLDYSGHVHLSSTSGVPQESRHTGYVIDLVSPGQRWRFAIDFSQTTFWFPASGIMNVGQFVGNITGGLIGGTQYKGIASGSIQEKVI